MSYPKNFVSQVRLGVAGGDVPWGAQILLVRPSTSIERAIGKRVHLRQYHAEL